MSADLRVADRAYRKSSGALAELLHLWDVVNVVDESLGSGEGGLRARTLSQVGRGTGMIRLVRPILPLVLKSSMARRLWFQVGACHGDRISAERGVQILDDFLECTVRNEIFSTDDEQIAPLGKGTIVGPYTPREATEHELEPVRVLGWPDNRLNKPLLHAKLLVLGELKIETYAPDDGPEFEELRFLPQSVWWGSANWTNGSRRHLEVGFACDDPSLLSDATDFVAQVISLSEPVDAKYPSPQSNLVNVEYDDEAMAEADHENYVAYLEAEAEREQALDYFEREPLRLRDRGAS